MSGLDEEEVSSEPEERRSEREAATAMRLRPSPPRVTRLSRRALAVLGGVSAVVVAGALLYQG